MVGLPYFLQVIVHFLKRLKLPNAEPMWLVPIMAVAIVYLFVSWAASLPDCSQTITTNCHVVE